LPKGARFSAAAATLVTLITLITLGSARAKHTVKVGLGARVPLGLGLSWFFFFLQENKVTSSRICGGQTFWNKGGRHKLIMKANQGSFRPKRLSPHEQAVLQEEIDIARSAGEHANLYERGYKNLLHCIIPTQDYYCILFHCFIRKGYNGPNYDDASRPDYRPEYEASVDEALERMRITRERVPSTSTVDRWYRFPGGKVRATELKWGQIDRVHTSIQQIYDLYRDANHHRNASRVIMVQRSEISSPRPGMDVLRCHMFTLGVNVMQCISNEEMSAFMRTKNALPLQIKDEIMRARAAASYRWPLHKLTCQIGHMNKSVTLTKESFPVDLIEEEPRTSVRRAISSAIVAPESPVRKKSTNFEFLDDLDEEKPQVGKFKVGLSKGKTRL